MFDACYMCQSLQSLFAELGRAGAAAPPKGHKRPRARASKAAGRAGKVSRASCKPPAAPPPEEEPVAVAPGQLPAAGDSLLYAPFSPVSDEESDAPDGFDLDDADMFGPFAFDLDGGGWEEDACAASDSEDALEASSPSLCSEGSPLPRVPAVTFLRARCSKPAPAPYAGAELVCEDDSHLSD